MKTERQYQANGTDVLSKVEYIERPVRRKFSKAYKRRIVKAAAECGQGETGALLRGEGLYSSQLTDWRRQEARGELAENSSLKRGRKGKAQATEVASLREENARLRRQVEQAELIIAAQKKLALALEQTLSEPKDKS